MFTMFTQVIHRERRDKQFFEEENPMRGTQSKPLILEDINKSPIQIKGKKSKYIILENS